MDKLLPFPTDPDRFLRCQESLETAMLITADAALSAGWTPEEVAAALVELADNYMLSVLANRDLSRELAIFKL